MVMLRLRVVYVVSFMLFVHLFIMGLVLWLKVMAIVVEMVVTFVMLI